MTRKRVVAALREMGFHPIKWHAGLWINNKNSRHRVKVSLSKRKMMNIAVTYSGTTWYSGHEHKIHNLILNEELLPLVFYNEKDKLEVNK